MVTHARCRPARLTDGRPGRVAGVARRDWFCPSTNMAANATLSIQAPGSVTRNGRSHPCGVVMADQMIDEAGLLPRALTEPTEHVRARWVTGLGLASLGMWMAALTPLQVLIPIQLQDITPRHKIAALSFVSAVGAISSGLATPLAGALSDRTTHGFAVGRLRGRRHRWTLGMALLGAAALAVLARQTTVAGVAILWVLFSAFQNAEYASLSAAIPDHVPVRQRATVAGWVGMPQALGLVLGTVLVVDVFTKVTSGYDSLAALLVLLTLPFVTPDHALDSKDR